MLRRIALVCIIIFFCQFLNSLLLCSYLRWVLPLQLVFFLLELLIWWTVIGVKKVLMLLIEKPRLVPVIRRLCINIYSILIIYGVLFYHLGFKNNIENSKFAEYIMTRNIILLMAEIWIKMFSGAKKVSSRKWSKSPG